MTPNVLYRVSYANFDRLSSIIFLENLSPPGKESKVLTAKSGFSNTSDLKYSSSYRTTSD